MPRTDYCVPTDVIRKLVPQQSQSDLTLEELIGNSDTEQIRARIEGIESRFEDRTMTALRTVRQGSTGSPETYEYLESKRSWRFPTQYNLDHRNVLPLDSSQGDKIEVRTARDNWRDITGDEGSRWTLVEPRKGKLEFYSRLRHTIQFRVRPGVRFIRLTYRYGGLGGSPTEGGETTLSSTLSKGSASSIGVADASRLPAGGGTMLVDGTEYIHVSSSDPSADTIDVNTRGLRGTKDQEHSSGAVVHYCPLQVREAVAAKTAREVQLYDDAVDFVVEGSEAPQPQARLDNWQSEWERCVAEYTQWRYS